MQRELNARPSQWMDDGIYVQRSIPFGDARRDACFHTLRLDVREFDPFRDEA